MHLRARTAALQLPPTFRAKVKVLVDGTARTETGSFPTLDDATAWRERARAELASSGALPASSGRARVPTLGSAARDFPQRAAAGKVLTRSRRPYARTTLASYESALKHVLPHRHRAPRRPARGAAGHR